MKHAKPKVKCFDHTAPIKPRKQANKPQAHKKKIEESPGSRKFKEWLGSEPMSKFTISNQNGHDKLDENGDSIDGANSSSTANGNMHNKGTQTSNTQSNCLISFKSNFLPKFHHIASSPS